MSRKRKGRGREGGWKSDLPLCSRRPSGSVAVVVAVHGSCTYIPGTGRGTWYIPYLPYGFSCRRAFPPSSKPAAHPARRLTRATDSCSYRRWPGLAGWLAGWLPFVSALFADLGELGWVGGITGDGYAAIGGGALAPRTGLLGGAGRDWRVRGRGLGSMGGV